MANEFINPNWHVILIHYPLGLVVAGFVIELFSFMWRRSGFRSAGRWMILLGALSAIPAAFSGIYALADAARMNNPAADGVWADVAAQSPLRETGAWDKLVRHAWLQAIATAVLVASVVTWIGCSDLWRKRLHLPLLLLLGGGVGLTAVGAWFSGEAVYRHGAAVELATGTDNTGASTAEEAGPIDAKAGNTRGTPPTSPVVPTPPTESEPTSPTPPPPPPRLTEPEPANATPPAPATSPTRTEPAPVASPAPAPALPPAPPPPPPPPPPATRVVEPEDRPAPPPPPISATPTTPPSSPPAAEPEPVAATPRPLVAPATAPSATATTRETATTRATTQGSNPAAGPNQPVASEEQTQAKRGVEYFLPPLQTHVFLAGVTVAIAMAALGLSIRKVSEAWTPERTPGNLLKDGETVEEVRRPIDQDAADLGERDARADLSDEIGFETDIAIQRAAHVPAGRFWMLTALLVLLTMAAGWWTLASMIEAFQGRTFGEAAKVLWEQVYNVELNAGSVFNRRFAHVLTGGVILVAPLVLAGLSRWGPRAKLWLWVFALLLILAVAAQVWLGVLLMYDLPGGPITRFNAPGTVP